MLKKNSALIFVILIYTSHLVAQSSYVIEGTTSISKDEFYYVMILSKQDSTLISSGLFYSPEFELGNIKEIDFILKISSPMLFNEYVQDCRNVDNSPVLDLGFIKLEPTNISLDEVLVTASLPQTTYRDGKYIHNIHNSLYKNLGSLNEILQRIPLVLVDKEEIKIFGKKNTKILVNGIEPKHTNWDLIRPEDIKEIEVITNPSVEYTSEMSAINIILKKRRAEGFNVLLSSSVVKADYWRSVNSLQLGYSTEKWNLYSSLNYNPGERKFVDNYIRTFPDGSRMYNDLTQKRKMKNYYNIVLGADYNLTQKSIIGAQFQRMSSETLSKTDNINNVFTPSGNSVFETFRDVVAPTTRNIYDLTYSYLIDAVGKNLNINVGYVDYLSKDNSNFIEYSTAEKQKESYSKADIDLITANIDYTHKTSKKFLGKLGIYYSHNKNNSSYQLMDITNNTQEESEFTNRTNIKEDKFAAYVSGRQNWDKFYISAGLRYEYVNYKNKGTKEDQSRTYNDFFPSVEAGYNINQNLQTNISYTRKVHYPTFQQLNPSMVYVDTLTYYVGNVDLLPEYSNNIVLNTVYKRFVTLSLGYSSIDRPLYLFTERLEPNSMILLASTENLKSEKVWTASLAIPYRYKLWTTQNTLGVKHNTNKFEIETDLKKISKAMYYFYTYNSFKLPADFDFSVTYQYNSSGINGIFYHDKRHIMNLALTKSLLKNQLTITLRADDIFKQDKQNTWVNLNDLGLVYKAKYDASYFALTLKYNFGKALKKYQIKQTTKDELKRIN